MNLSEKDLQQIAQRGISQEQIETQLHEFETGFPFLRLEAAAAIGRGIVAPDADERKDFIAAWENYKAEGHRIVKFVPASGAASRMFKNIFAFVDGEIVGSAGIGCVARKEKPGTARCLASAWIRRTGVSGSDGL